MARGSAPRAAANGSNETPATTRARIAIAREMLSVLALAAALWSTFGAQRTHQADPVQQHQMERSK